MNNNNHYKFVTKHINLEEQKCVKNCLLLFNIPVHLHYQNTFYMDFFEILRYLNSSTVCWLLKYNQFVVLFTFILVMHCSHLIVRMKKQIVILKRGHFYY